MRSKSLRAPSSANARPSRSGELADRLLQDRPRLVAVFRLPLRIETGGAQFVAERSRTGLIEREALRGQVGLQGGVQLGDVVALLERRGIDVLGDDTAH